MLFDTSFQDTLLKLLEINSVTPMETGRASSIPEAQALFAERAKAVGMSIVFEGPGELPSDLMVPLMVSRRAEQVPDFLACQPHLVLEWGNGPAENTVMFNMHMDTVSAHLDARMDGDTFHGRGAVDNKGPGVAILAALEALNTRSPGIKDKIRVLIQSVSGEEGGAMGIYGSRHLANLGFTGRLNVYVEPTHGTWIDESTTSMTLELSINGKGSTDDFPEQGHNATLLLSHLGAEMAAILSEPLDALGVKMTLAGLHTGNQHNRVYGQGTCLFNFSYASLESAHQTRELSERAYETALASFQEKFARLPPFSLTAEQAGDVSQMQWLKTDLPVLNNRDGDMETLLSTCGVTRNLDPSAAFTCDAMWGQGDGKYSIVMGPGSLATNGAHTDLEHVSLTDLEEFTQTICTLLQAFADR